MKVVDLTAPQQTQAAANKAAIVAAQTALATALKAQVDYLRTAAGAKATDRVQLADDGTCVIIG